MSSVALSQVVGFSCWGTPGPRRASAALAQDYPGKLGQTLWISWLRVALKYWAVGPSAIPVLTASCADAESSCYKFAGTELYRQSPRDCDSQTLGWSGIGPPRRLVRQLLWPVGASSRYRTV